MKAIFVIHEDSGKWEFIKTIKDISEKFPELKKVQPIASRRFREHKKTSKTFMFREWGYRFYYTNE